MAPPHRLPLFLLTAFLAEPVPAEPPDHAIGAFAVRDRDDLDQISASLAEHTVRMRSFPTLPLRPELAIEKAGDTLGQRELAVI